MRPVYDIDGLRLDPDARVLTHAGNPVALGARAVAVLTALVRRAGEYVSKSEIMDAAWPGLVVEEANIAVQISAIRRALAGAPGSDRWIETLARRGYRFVGPVKQLAGHASASAAAVDGKHSNLPQVLTSFVGREKELAEIKRLLPAKRLLTLTGTGGIGKTRLALQAAEEVRDAYRDGAWFVDLAPLANPALVPSAVAQVFAVKESAGQPLLVSLCEHLRGKELLLVLDNCEHLLGACADLADSLLRDTARVSIIATSREPLHVATEHACPVGVLPLPETKADSQTIARADAVRLFVDRARQHRPRFDLEDLRAQAVAEICVRLDGIPLALELAAARVAVLPVEEIARRLDQRFRLLTSGSRDELPRQQTLRAMIDWSFELLDEAERLLFARLSVFAGGWTVAAATAVCAGGVIAEDALVYVLIALIEKSLVVADEDGDRYRMLETVREYAKEKLDQGSAEAVGERHRAHFLALAEEAAPKLHSGEQAEWYQRLEVEHENLRSALAWTVGAPGTAEGLRMCFALQRFWLTRGHLTEGLEWCFAMLEKDAGKDETPERAKVLNAAGSLSYYQSNHSQARTLYEKSLAIGRRLADTKAIAIAVGNLGILAREQGDVSAAKAMFEEAIVFRREQGDRLGLIAPLINLGQLNQEQGNLELARTNFKEGLELARALGERFGFAMTLLHLGEITHQLGERDAGKALADEGLAVMRALDDHMGTSTALQILGNFALDRGDHRTAGPLFREGLGIRQAMGYRRGIIFSLEGLAAVVAGFGGTQHAAQIWGAAEQLRDEIGLPLAPNQRREYDRNVAAARATHADDAAFDRAWREGRAMTLERAIALAQDKSVEG